MKQYRIIAECGSVEHTFMEELTEKEATEICEGYDWSINFTGDGSPTCEWDLVIEPMEEETDDIYELVIVWWDEMVDVFRYPTKEETERHENEMRIANGEQIKWSCVRERK